MISWDLPFDIVTEILARVPVEDLQRFRFVCKSWRTLFQDERFIRKHTTHASSMFMLVAPWGCHTPSNYTCCTYEGRRLKATFQEPKLMHKDWIFETRVIGYCDGLFCLVRRKFDDSFAVWNPALRELRKIPFKEPWRLMGFGYDHTIQDYKIVSIPFTGPSEAQVFTLKSSVCRMIDFPWRQKCDVNVAHTQGILLGVNIFWALYPCYPTIEIDEDILTFNLVSETFSFCSGPDRKPMDNRYFMAFRGSLCVIESETGSYCDDRVVWCADHEKEDKGGLIKSWSMILRLTASDIERSTHWRLDVFQLGCVINQAGLLFVIVRTLEQETKLCEYNLEEKTVRKVETSMFSSLDYFDNLEKYIATLVPTT